MINRLFALFLIATLFSCLKDDEDNFTDIDYFDFDPDTELTCQTNRYGWQATGIDINRDGIPDFSIIASYTAEDGINNMQDAYHIYIEPEYQYNNEYNPFTPAVSMDDNSYVKLYDEDNGEFNDNSGVYLYHWLYKVDELDSYTPEKNGYILVRLRNNRKSDDYYYGWIQIDYDGFKLIVMDQAYCTVPNKKIRPGQVKN